VKERLVVIGGDAAGMSAASQARRRRSAAELEIIAFERSNWVSYSACGEPYHVAGYVDRLESLIARTPQQFRAMDIDVRTRHEVTDIDLSERVVTVRDLEHDQSFFTEFDQLMIATGARAVRPGITGRDLEGVHELRTLDDASRLRQLAEAGRGNAVIVGGGYIGLEAAEAFHAQGWKVTVVTSGQRVLDRTLHSDLGQKVIDAMRRIGIDVVLGTRVECINGGNRVESVGCSDETYPADAVVLGLGSAPEVDLAVRAGVPLGSTGAIAVDERQRTGSPGVWSAGDCAEARHRITGKQVNIHLGTIANKAGRVAGVNIGGGDATFPGVLGTAITKVLDVEIASTGLRLTDARSEGFDAVEGRATGTTTAGYYPTASDLTISTVAEKGTGRIIGAQIVGGSGAAKRIDVFATAIWSNMTVQDLAWVDLAYAPPFSGVWDLIHISARNAARLALA
jgi:NADPH-dependent 2,4-dienoyl-CoA reductase/sulfur reductase-like enzyme